MAAAVAPPYRRPTVAKDKQRLNHSRKYYPYLSLSAVQNHEEIQIGLSLPKLESNSAARCDGCGFVPLDYSQSPGKRVLYYCLGCGNGIFLCQPCARAKIRQTSDYHKADHRLKPWQPSLFFDIKETLTAPNLSIRRNNTVREDFVTNLCARGIFYPPEIQQSRSIRCFLSTPPGRYYVKVKLKVFFDPHAFQRPDIMDRAFGKVLPSSQSLGSIRMLGKPLSAISRPKPGNGMTEWVNWPIYKSNELALIYVVNLGNVIVGPGDSCVEIVFQDHCYTGKFIYDRPFTWRISGITLSPDYAPKLFATKGELLQATNDAKQEKNEEKQNRAEQFKDFMEDRQKAKEEEHELQQHQANMTHQLEGLHLGSPADGRPQNGWHNIHTPQQPGQVAFHQPGPWSAGLNALGGAGNPKVKPFKRPKRLPGRPVRRR